MIRSSIVSLFGCLTHDSGMEFRLILSHIFLILIGSALIINDSLICKK